MTGRTLAMLALACLLVPAAFAQGPANALTQEELSALAPHFVVVKFHFKRNEEEVRPSFDMFEMFDPESLGSGMYQSFLDAKKPLKVIGLAVGPDTVLMTDIILDDDYLDSIEVAGLRGGASPAKRVAILEKSPGMILRIEDPAKLNLEPVEFAALDEPVGADARFLEVAVQYQAEDCVLIGRPVPAGARLGQGDGSVETILMPSPMDFTDISQAAQGMALPSFVFTMFGEMNEIWKSPTLLLDGQKRPVGVALESPLSATPGKPPLWRGQVLVDADRISFDELEVHKTALETRLGQSLAEIRVTFRQEADESGGMFGGVSFDFNPLDFMGGGGVPTEKFYYGLAVSPRTLFVPTRISREHAKVIDRIEVENGDGKIVGRFAGAFEDIAAFLITVDEDLETEPAQIVDADTLPAFEPLLTVHAQRRFGGKNLRINYTRATSKIRGYKDVLEPILLGQQPVGVFCADLSGAILAVHIGQRKEDEDKQGLDPSDIYSMASSLTMGGTTRVYAMGELTEHFSEPAPLLDKTILALSKEEEDRRMWLGVEFEPMTKELAESLSLEEATKDGSIGLVVSTVYPGSPAERLSIQSGDVLLKIEESGDQEPTELRVSGDRMDYSFDFSDLDIPGGIDVFDFDYPSPPLWKSRANVITRLLEVIGDGEEIALTYLAGGTKKVTKFVFIEQAPPDFDSAPKVKDADLGITVKAITYEVRHALKMADELNPVVVAKVEEGEPASVAQIREFDLITRVDDTRIDGPESFKAVIDAARAQKEQTGKATLRLTLQRMDKTRIVDITLE